jgi:hypothetical protein
MHDINSWDLETIIRSQQKKLRETFTNTAEYIS